MNQKYDAQILVRLQDGLKEFASELAKESGCSTPEWVREAIMQRIERECDLNFDRSTQ